METKELRIGNLVEDHNSVMCEISPIASNSVIVTGGVFGSIQITPILLMDEELECIELQNLYYSLTGEELH